MNKFKLFLGVLSVFAFGMAACGASATAEQVPVPQPAVTPDVDPYLTAYFKYLDEWSTGVNHVRDVNTRLADGSNTLADDALKLQLADALTDLEEASNGMAGLTPPVTQLQYFQDKGRELDDQTRIFTSMYVKALSGDNESKDTAVTAFNNAVNIYNEIVAEFNRVTDITIPE